jgi:hypothetical protein
MADQVADHPTAMTFLGRLPLPVQSQGFDCRGRDLAPRGHACFPRSTSLRLHERAFRPVTPRALCSQYEQPFFLESQAPSRLYLAIYILIKINYKHNCNYTATT